MIVSLANRYVTLFGLCKEKDGKMVRVTESAKQRLKKISLRAFNRPEAVLRLIVNTSRQMALVVDNKTERDQIVQYQGTTVLVVNKELSAALGGLGIDYHTGKGLHLVRI
jgi:Fe-S cluster assembly iron-binding protein IscA